MQKSSAWGICGSAPNSVKRIFTVRTAKVVVPKVARTAAWTVARVRVSGQGQGQGEGQGQGWG